MTTREKEGHAVLLREEKAPPPPPPPFASKPRSCPRTKQRDPEKKKKKKPTPPPPPRRRPPPPPPHTKAPMPTQHIPTTTSKPHTSQANLTRPAQYTIHLLTYRRSDIATASALRSALYVRRRLQIVEHAADTLSGRRGVTNYRRSYVATASALLTLYAYAYARCRLQQSRHAS